MWIKLKVGDDGGARFFCAFCERLLRVAVRIRTGIKCFSQLLIRPLSRIKTGDLLLAWLIHVYCGRYDQLRIEALIGQDSHNSQLLLASSTDSTTE